MEVEGSRPRSKAVQLVLYMFSAIIRYDERVWVPFSQVPAPVLGSMQLPSEWVSNTLFLWVNRWEREDDHWRLSGAKVKNVWSCTSSSLYAFLSAHG